MDQITDLALATIVIHQFRGIPNNLFNMEKFWRHSIACGVSARAMAEFRGEKNVERFYLAGILHDIGRLVIIRKEPALARDTFYRSKERRENIYLSEQKLMGFDHAAVGQELLKAWQLPQRLVEAVGCHHQPQNAETFPVEAALIHTADYIVHILQAGSDADFSDPELYSKSWEIIGLSADDFEFMKSKIFRQFQGVIGQFFDISR